MLSSVTKLPTLAREAIFGSSVPYYTSGSSDLKSLVPPLPDPPAELYKATRLTTGAATPRPTSSDGCGMVVKLAPYQEDLIRRFASQCRRQRGGLWLLRMGSGKTLAALGLLNNLPPPVVTPSGRVLGRRVVLSPAGITSNFEFVADPSKGTDALMKSDIFKMYPSQAAAAARAQGLHIVTYTPKPGYDSLVDLLAGRAVSGLTLEELLDGAYIVADEAHNLLRFLPNERLVAAFGGAARVYLMTGTPIVNAMANFGQLVALASGLPPSVMPVEDNAFKAAFFRRTWGGFLQEAGVNALYLLSNAATKTLMMALGVNLMSPLIASAWDNPTWANVTATADALVRQDMTRLGTAAPAGWWLAAEAVAGTVTFSLQLMLQRYIAAREYRTLDTAALLKVVAKYITFFDYELVPPAQQLHFPRKDVQALGVPYTAFQARLLSRLMVPRTLTAEDRAALAMPPWEDPSKEEAFFKYARAVGNASRDWFTHGTRWNDAQACWEAVPLSLSASASPSLSLPPSAAAATAVPFDCPKFAAIARLLVEHAVRGNPRMRSVQPRFLPVVYSSFDALGFQRFGAYLTARGLRYLTFHEADPPAHRARLLEAANARYAPVPAPDAVGDSPVCVLLHPAITEGLSFTDAPSIIVLETIDGYGVQEQVYGRILRRYPKPFADTAARPIKTIYQFFGQWPMLGAATAGGLAEYAVQYNGGVTGAWQVAIYRDKFPDGKTVEADTTAKNDEQRRLLDTLAQAFVKNDDAVEGAVCVKEAGEGDKPCRVCLRGDCDCKAGAGGDPVCPSLPDPLLAPLVTAGGQGGQGGRPSGSFAPPPPSHKAKTPAPASALLPLPSLPSLPSAPEKPARKVKRASPPKRAAASPKRSPKRTRGTGKGKGHR